MLFLALNNDIINYNSVKESGGSGEAAGGGGAIHK